MTLAAEERYIQNVRDCHTICYNSNSSHFVFVIFRITNSGKIKHGNEDFVFCSVFDKKCKAILTRFEE